MAKICMYCSESVTCNNHYTYTAMYMYVSPRASYTVHSDNVHVSQHPLSVTDNDYSCVATVTVRNPMTRSRSVKHIIYLHLHEHGYSYMCYYDLFDFLPPVFPS